MSQAPGRTWLAGALSAAVTLTVLAALAWAAAVAAYLAPGPRSPSASATTIVLRRGSGLAEIAATLRRAGVIGSQALFVASAQLTGAARRLKPGEYDFPSRVSLREVIRRIAKGDVLHHHITIPEGLTSAQTVEILARSLVLKGATPPPPPEGALLPETYDVLRGDSRAEVLRRMAQARDRLLAQLWAHRRSDLPYPDPEQAVTLASIVEKETAKAAERPRVAGVYLNRLRLGMNLDADPTVIYGVDHGLPLGRGLTMIELRAPTPYNTYVNPGLPPTPIDNPGRASLAAVMDPTPTHDLYFVADGTGGHVFARTLAEQARHVARWRALEVERKEAAMRPRLREHR